MCSAGNVRVSLEEEFFKFILADNSFDFPQANAWVTADQNATVSTCYEALLA